MAILQITVEKYPTPLKQRGFDFMARDAVDEAGRAIYGFGATEEEAIADFRRQLETDCDA